MYMQCIAYWYGQNLVVLPGGVVVVVVVVVVGGTSTLQVRLAVLVEPKFKAS